VEDFAVRPSQTRKFIIPALAIALPLACVDAQTEDGLEYEFVEVGQGASIEPAFAPGSGKREPVLRLLLTDAPAAVEAVFVSIDHAFVQACDDEDCVDSEWIDVMDEPVTFDLLTLQEGDTVELATAKLAAGFHGQIHLVVSEASVVIHDHEYSVEVPPVAVTLTGGFDLEPNMATEITIDFDAAQSLIGSTEHGWTLRPAVSIVSVTTAPL
jgi:hypothetical protein